MPNLFLLLWLGGSCPDITSESFVLHRRQFFRFFSDLIFNCGLIDLVNYIHYSLSSREGHLRASLSCFQRTILLLD